MCLGRLDIAFDEPQHFLPVAFVPSLDDDALSWSPLLPRYALNGPTGPLIHEDAEQCGLAQL